MRKGFTLASFLVLLLAAPAGIAHGQIIVTGQGRLLAEPDRGSLAISVVTEAVTPDLAAQLNDQVRSVLVNRLVNQGVRRDDVSSAGDTFVAPLTATIRNEVPFVAGFAVTNQMGGEAKFTLPVATVTIGDKGAPKFDFKPAGLERKDIAGGSIQPRLGGVKIEQPVVIGYRVVNEYSVALRDVSRLGQVCRACTQTPSCFFVLTLSSGDQNAHYGQAREAAVTDARRKAETIARGLGCKVAGVKKLAESPIASRPPLLDGKLVYKVEVTAEFDVTPLPEK